MSFHVVKTTKRAAALSGLLLLLWLGGFGLFAFTSLMAAPSNTDDTTDAIVVLTGGTHRIEEGLALFAAGRARHLFISGVHEHVSKADIENMWKGETTLPPCCLALGHQATTTTQNAQETRQWIVENGYSSLRLVTSNYHMKRAALEMRHALPDIKILLHPVTQTDLKLRNKHLWELLFVEYHKFIFRKVQLLFTPGASSLLTEEKNK